MRSGLLILLGSRINIPIWVVRKLLEVVQWLDQNLFRRQSWDSQEIKHIVEVIKSSRESRVTQSSHNTSGKLTLIVVVAEKDLEILPLVIRFAKRGLSHLPLESIKVITPNVAKALHALESKKLTDSVVNVIDENQILPCSEIRAIFSVKFPGRENWCLQQFLKFYAVNNSYSKYAIVVDADTLLINKQPWVTKSKGNDILGLTPTFEYQKQYYEVLIGLGTIKKEPKFSFVPHHMFYEVEIVKSIISALEFDSPIVFAKKVESLSNETTHAPFCIDYELYAQYLMEKDIQRLRFLKWSNLPINRSFFLKYLNRDWIISLLSILFNSISLHSWSDGKTNS